MAQAAFNNPSAAEQCSGTNSSPSIETQHRRPTDAGVSRMLGRALLFEVPGELCDRHGSAYEALVLDLTFVLDGQVAAAVSLSLLFGQSGVWLGLDLPRGLAALAPGSRRARPMMGKLHRALGGGGTPRPGGLL